MKCAKCGRLSMDEVHAHFLPTKYCESGGYVEFMETILCHSCVRWIVTEIKWLATTYGNNSIK